MSVHRMPPEVCDKNLSSMRFLNASISRLAGLLLTVAGSYAASSCGLLYEDLEPCPTGVHLRIEYAMHPELGDVRPAQADCLTLLVYDAEGRHVHTETFHSDVTSNEEWRLNLNLAPGTYKFVAWGGLDCDDASFSFKSAPATTPMQELEVSLKSGYTDKPLHTLFYGSVDVDVPEGGDDTGLTDATLPLTRDTNDLRILLANVNGLPTDINHFDVSLITDNTLLGWDNDLLNAGETVYTPWASGNSEFGITDLGFSSVMAYAEISTSRLVWGNKTTLLVTRKSDGKEVIRVPLLNLLLNYKSDRWAWMDNQEFFDRVNYWPITFFLTSDDVWLRTTIVVDDWIVRINNAELW